MNDASRPATGGAYVAQHRSVADEISERVRQETGHRYADRAGLLLPVRAAARPVARARRQRPDRGARRATASRGGRGGPDRLRLRPHGGHLRPRHRGRGDRGEGSASSSPAPRPPGVDPRFVAMVRDLLLERAAVERGAEVAPRQRRRAGRRRGTCCPAGCCANPRGDRPALCGQGLTCRVRRTTTCSTLARRRWPSRPPSWSRAPAPRGRRGRGHQVQPGRRRHRGRPGGRGADLRPADGRPARRRVPRRGGRPARSPTSGVTWVVDPIDGTVNFLYGIPHYAVSIAAARRRRRRSPGSWSTSQSGERFTATRGGGVVPGRRPPAVRGPARRPRCRSGWSSPASTTWPTCEAQADRRGRPRCCHEVRDIRRLGSAALDLCSVACGRVDAYVEEGLQLWDLAAGGLVATEAGARLEVHPGVGGKRLRASAPRRTASTSSATSSRRAASSRRT